MKKEVGARGTTMGKTEKLDCRPLPVAAEAHLDACQGGRDRWRTGQVPVRPAPGARPTLSKRRRGRRRVLGACAAAPAGKRRERTVASQAPRLPCCWSTLAYAGR